METMLDNPEQYGILTEPSSRELFEKINRRYLCEECRAARKGFLEKDRGEGVDGKKHLGIIIPGFSSPKVVPLDIMIIAESIGGGRKDDFRQEASLPLELVIPHLRNYYFSEQIIRFHQYEMRKMLNWLENDLKKTWVFTDQVKCFVYQGREIVEGEDGNDNMKKAIKHCSKYLDEQIQCLNPKVFLVLGKKVAENYCDIKGRRLRELTHGQRGTFNKNGISYNFIYSIFPSGRTADIWVKNIDAQNDDAWLPVKNSLQECFS